MDDGSENEDRSTAYREGWLAGGDDVPFEDNPYDEGTPEYEEWAEGWGDAVGPTVDPTHVDPDFQED
jgi:hypothetical protein